jgi:hypothetical protein
MGGIRIGFGSLALLCLLMQARPAGWSQMPAPITTSGASSTRASRHMDDDMDPMQRSLPESYSRMQNSERQRHLVSDTERLLTLTNQLKASIASSGSEALTPEMLRQMDEIEKLARSVKNKMRN